MVEWVWSGGQEEEEGRAAAAHRMPVQRRARRRRGRDLGEGPPLAVLIRRDRVRELKGRVERLLLPAEEVRAVQVAVDDARAALIPHMKDDGVADTQPLVDGEAAPAAR